MVNISKPSTAHQKSTKLGAFLVSGFLALLSIHPALALTGSEGITLGSPCSSTNTATIAHDTDGDRRGVVLVCDGSNWQLMRPTFSGSCSDGDIIVYNSTTGGMSCGLLCDSIANLFEFTDIAGQTLSTLTTSNTLSITGTDSSCDVNVSISGGGSPQYRICSNSICSSVVQDWTSANTTHDMNGRFLQIRATSASTADTAVDVTINVGVVSDNWRVDTSSTGPCGATPTIGQVCSDGSVYAGISTDDGRHMYVARCDVGMSWSGSACTGTRSLLPWNDGNSNWTTVGVPDDDRGENNTANIIVTDSNNVAPGVQEHEAAQACADYDDGNGNTDWYLPSRSELGVIYENLVDGSPDDNNPDPVISGFSTGGLTYWSSSENNLNMERQARQRRFNDGNNNVTNKDSLNAVRCARK